ncbi:enhancer of polycomb homolog 1-like isoform X1 [Gadus macrocephalus]|uniref:enhancer of polycomb homolog 1-like isoform X1 n=2 Tax=Gadus macrocephalus TaxID=80720 RepID=UPI0028CBA6CC|nr:enhancer of polycomb homolog 1-like isoform X1 [Gadus macrocephalus]
MSKLSFRARALDAAKPLPVFRCEDLPDLHEYASINRAVPQMPTGMEKEEESEHHLQRAISAQQVYGEKRDSMVIPVPEGQSDIGYYESLYPGDFKMPKQLIHIQPAFCLDAEQPDYDLDTDDETFVNKLKKKMEITALQLEDMIDRLEKGSGQQLVSLKEAKLLLKEDDELIKEVFEYWSRKRKGCHAGYLIPSVKHEKRDGSSTSDPYVGFRRRTEKMQTRKNRKNDEASYEKMLKLRRDLSRAVTILEMIKRREKSKRELLHLTLEIVEKRYVTPDYGSEVMAETLAQCALVKPVYTIPILPPSSNSQYRHQDHLDLKDYKKPEKSEVVRTKRKYEKKPKAPPLAAPAHLGPAVFSPKDLNQYDFPSSDEESYSQLLSGSSEAEEENDPDGGYAFRRKAGCQYYAAHQDQNITWPWVSPSQGGQGDPRYRYCLTSLTAPRRCLGLARRRTGRGGRLLLDRAHTDLDPVYQNLDSDPEPEHPASSPAPPPALSSPLRDSNTSTSDSITSGSSRLLPAPPSSSASSSSCTSSVAVDLARVLLNVKSCRWRHFRPRTLPRDPSGAGFMSRRGLLRRFQRTGSGLSRPLAGGGPTQPRPAPPPVNVLSLEQYQQHQDQLALMQKQQLEQIQQQLAASDAPSAASTQGLVSKTLDQASAQFAASALVTGDQLLAFKAKEEPAPGGVNGVLPAAGVFKGLHPSPASSTPHRGNQPPGPPASGPVFLQPSSKPVVAAAAPSLLSSSPHTAAALGLLGPSPPAGPTQVLIGNNLRLSVASAGGLGARHLPRALGGVAPSALKLAAAAGLPLAKGPGAPPVDPRESREPEPPSLSSIVDNTVAMEVT